MAGQVKRGPAHQRTVPVDTARRMPRKSLGDKMVEARIRAHIRWQMHDRGINQAGVCRLTGVDDGNLTRILNEGRGIGFSTLLKLCNGLKITPTRILETNPPKRFWDIAELPREKESSP